MNFLPVIRSLMLALLIFKTGALTRETNESTSTEDPIVSTQTTASVTTTDALTTEVTTDEPVILNVTIISATTTSLLVGWEFESGVDNITEVYCHCIDEFNADCIDKSCYPDDNNLCNCTGLTPGSEYNATVTTENNLEFLSSNSACTITSPATDITRNDFDPSSITLDWDISGNYTGFTIAYNNGTKDTDTMPHTLTGLSEHTAYQIRITTLNEICDDSEASETIELWTDFIPINTVTAVTNSNTSISASWTHDAPSMNYTVYCNCIQSSIDEESCTSDTQTLTSDDGNESGNFSATCEDLRPGTLYDVILDAHGHDYTRNTTSQVVTVPNTASDVRMTDATTETISLEWIAPSGAYTHFVITVDGVEHDGTADTNYTVEGLSEHNYHVVTVTTVASYVDDLEQRSPPTEEQTFYTEFSELDNLTFVANSNSSARVTWEHTALNVTYTVDCLCTESLNNAGICSNHSSFLDPIPANENGTYEYECTELTAGSQYEARVTTEGFEDVTVTERKSTITFPNAATNLTKVTATVSNLSVWWEAPTEGGYTGFQVIVNGTVRATPSATSYLIEGLDEHTLHEITVITVAVYDDVNVTASINVTHSDYTDFSAISSEDIAVNTFNTTSVEVTWVHNVPNMLGYLVQCKCVETQGCVNSIVMDVDPGLRSVECTGLKPGSPYNVSITAQGQNNDKPTESNTFNVTNPEVVSNFSAQGINSGEVNLTWVNPDKFTTVSVYNNTDVLVYEGNGSSCLVGNLHSSSHYSFYVITEVVYNGITSVSERSKVAEAYTYPGLVRNVSAVNVTAWGFTLTFTPPEYTDTLEMYLVNVHRSNDTDASVYRSDNVSVCESYVVRLENSTFGDEKLGRFICTEVTHYQTFYENDVNITIVVANQNEAVLGVVVPYHNYSVQVYAINEAGVGDEQEVVNIVKTAEAPPGSPVYNVTTVAKDAYSIDISWDAPLYPHGEITNYTVIYTWTPCVETEENMGAVTVTGAGQDTVIQSEGVIIVDEPTATITGLDSFTNFTFTVLANNSQGAGESESEPHMEETDATDPESVAVEITDVQARNLTFEWAQIHECSLNGTFLCYYIDICFVDPLKPGQPEVCESLLMPDITITSKVIDAFPFVNYTVKVIVGNAQGFNSTASEDTARTLEDVPTAPVNLTLVPASNQINVTWEIPDQPNGVILGYNVTWKNLNPADVNCTQEPRKCGGFKIVDANNKTYIITGLQPYDNYTVSVVAETGAGYGEAVAEQVELHIGSPVPPEKVMVTSLNSTALQITWVMTGVETGPTTYYVFVNTSSDCDQGHRNFSVEGFENTVLVVTGLHPYVNYSVQVFAVVRDDMFYYEKEAKYSDNIPPKEKTHASNPGAVRELRTQKPADICYGFNVTWTEPGQCEMNGEISHYVIKWTNNNTGETNNKTCNADECATGDGPYVTEVTGLDANNGNYTFQVLAVVDQNLEGTVSEKSNSTGLCSPVIPGGDGVQSSSASLGDARKQFAVMIDINFLNNQTNGDLVRSSVLVVREGYEDDYKDCCELVADFDGHFVTWSKAKQSGFTTAYAIDNTEERLSVRRSRRNADLPDWTVADFVVGSDSDGCSDYCNGPLADDKKYKVALVTCTQTGCAVREWSDIAFVTAKDTSNPTDKDFTPLIASMSVFIVVLIAALVGAVVAQRNGYLDRFKKKTAGPGPTVVIGMHPIKPAEPVKLSDFKTYTAECHKDTNMKFADQYTEIGDKSVNHSWDQATQPENKPKNRFINILPFDQSRVKLLPDDDIDGSDYINANYMPGYNSRREFIAAQGPLGPAPNYTMAYNYQNTVDEFWRMVWEQNCSIIVMLANCVEKGKLKCAQYWPADQEPVHNGEVQVTLLSESVIGDYVVRVMDVSSGQTRRQIKQLHFIKWPDFGCPKEPKDLLNFVQVVRREINPSMIGPVLVHCSAGVGRTGTFIIVDRLLQHIRDHDTLDVFSTVLDMREYRAHMVQSEDQYIFIHDCLVDAIERGMHLGPNEQVYSNIGVDLNLEEEEEPVYANAMWPTQDKK